MPYPEHHLVTFGGSINPASKERWSCGIRFGLEGSFAADFEEDDWLENQGEHLNAWGTRAGSRIGFGVTIDFIKCNAIDANGHYKDATKSHTRQVNWPIGSATSSLPFQACYVVTTRTNAVARGPGSHGRFYVPRPAVTCGTDGLFTASWADEMAESARILLDELEVGSGASFTFRPNIVSKVGSGSQHLIDYVTVDNRVDTQRRRANQLAPVISVSDQIVY